MYKALYRKYRPQSFDEVTGQFAIIETLKNSIINNDFSHAYMFFGPRGTGKTTVSKIFARAVNCLSPVDGNACGKCDNCKNSFEKECADIIEIDAASNNGVDEIRDLRNKISLVPNKLKYKVYIIDEVHMLSLGAFNALLKTLEEPPAHVVFILATTDPQKVPETIISRCQCFSFKRIAENDIVERLKYVVQQEKIKIDDNVISSIAAFSEGGMRDALGMLDKLSAYTKNKITEEDFVLLNDMITKSDLESFSSNIFSNNIREVLNDVKKFNDSGKNLIQIILQLVGYLRNLLVEYYVDNKECKYDIDAIKKLINLINDKIINIKKSGNPRIYIEMLLIDFCSESTSKIVEEKVVEKEIKKDDDKEKKILNKKKLNIDSASEIKQNIKSSQTNVREEVSSNLVSCSNKILNIKDIMEARVNNIMVEANKKILLDVIEKFKSFKNYVFDLDINYVACALLDANVRAASANGIILSYKYDSVVEQNLNIIENITTVYNDITKSKIKFAIVSDDYWDKKKLEYMKDIKAGKHWKLIIEPEKEVLEEKKKNDIIGDSTAELFGDIVEYE